MITLVRWLSRFKRRSRLLKWLARSEGAIPCLVFAFCLMATIGMAAGSAMTFTVVDPTASIVTTNAVRMDPPIIKIQVDWISDDTTGAVTGTLPYSVGEIVRIITDPGTPAPTTLYDIAIIDPKGLDLLAQAQDDLADRHTTTTEQIYPFLLNYDATPIGTPTFPTIHSAPTVNVTNAGNSTQGQIIIFLKTR